MRIVKKTLKAHHFREPAPEAPASRAPRRPPAPGPAASGQRTLDDEELVIVAPEQGLGLRAAAPAPAGSFSSLVDDSAASAARLTLAHALYRDLGQPGTILDSPKGASFALRRGVGAGEVRVPHQVLVPLPEGHVIPHRADLVVEMENGALLILDVITNGIAGEALRAQAYDALQFRRLDRSFALLVVIRQPRPSFTQDQIEAIGHGYDHFFGIDEADLRSEAKYAALRSRIAAWISAAGGR